jgi:hypothetical protein
MAKEAFLPLFFGDFWRRQRNGKGKSARSTCFCLDTSGLLAHFPMSHGRICKLVGWDSTLFERSWVVVSSKFPQAGGAEQMPDSRCIGRGAKRSPKSEQLLVRVVEQPPSKSKAIA